MNKFFSILTLIVASSFVLPVLATVGAATPDHSVTFTMEEDINGAAEWVKIDHIDITITLKRCDASGNNCTYPERKGIVKYDTPLTLTWNDTDGVFSNFKPHASKTVKYDVNGLKNCIQNGNVLFTKEVGSNLKPFVNTVCD